MTVVMYMVSLMYNLSHDEMVHARKYSATKEFASAPCLSKEELR